MDVNWVRYVTTKQVCYFWDLIALRSLLSTDLFRFNICLYFADPIRAVRAVLLEIIDDDALSTGLDGTKLCCTYAETLSKQLTIPTDQDKCLLNSSCWV